MTNTQKFEVAWAAVIDAMKRADKIRADGGKPRYAVRNAKFRLEAVCNELGIETPKCLWS
jgi:hypothetical protein